MLVRPLLFSLAFRLLMPLESSAQDPGAERRIARSREALAPLAGLVGQWEGPARATVGPGRTLEARQSEDVAWGSNATVLIVRGTGRSVADADKGRILFEATAMIWYDPETDRVRMRTHRDGQSLEPELEIKPDTIIWGFDVPGGRVRYTTAFGGGRWHEIGEFLRAGAPPIRTMEMTLERRAAAP